MRTAILVIVIVILLAIFGPQTLFTVDETQFAVVTRFGQIKSVHTSPGLKVKAPFIDSVNRFDNRLLRIDTLPATLNDIEKEFLVIDAYTRYRINPDEGDVTKFFEKLRTLTGAEQRIGSIVTSNLKEEIAQRTKEEIIGARREVGTQGEDVFIPTGTREEILARVLEAANREVGPPKKYLRVDLAEERGADIGFEVPDARIIQIGGERLLEITDAQADGLVDQELVEEIGEDFGVTVVEVRIKRADFPPEALPNIFNRMEAERQRISRETRAEGAEEDLKIRAAVNKQRTIILADANRSSNLIRGAGEARAVEIFADALEQDPEFFAFQRSLEFMKNTLTTNTTVVLSSKADLFKFLEQPEILPDVVGPRAIVDIIDRTDGNLWTVGGQTVLVNGATTIQLDAVPDEGLSVFVEGEFQDDGSIVASQVTRGLTGRLEQISVVELVVDGQVIAVNETTDFLFEPGPLSIVYVEGERTDDQLVATLITEGVRGTLEAIATGDAWTVSTIEITVNVNTQQDPGVDAIGSDLLLSVERQRDGSLVAMRITHQQPAQGSPTSETVETLVGPVDGLTQEWLVEGSAQGIIVNEESNIQLGADQVGLVVLIGFILRDDGSTLALEGRIA